MNHNLHLGVKQSAERLYLREKARTTHMHVVGASGRGKSYLLEYMIRQDIANGDGVCLIDPHGTLFRNIVSWCIDFPLMRWDKLILLDASAPGFTFGFNPLAFTGANISYAVDSMVGAVSQVWGGEDTNTTPRLKRILRGIFHVLAEKRLTLLESQYLISERDRWRPLREHLTADLADPIVREEWAKWNELRPQEFMERFESATNRLDEFLKPAAIRAIVGQRDPVIDFRQAMDEGYVVLVNLEPRGELSDLNARTLGALIVNDLFLKGQGRPLGSRPFYLYIDECGRYVNESIQRMLDESRKRGLHLILAHQHLAQLKAAGETVYSAVMTDAQTKVIFGGLMTADAETMVREVFLGLDLEEPKPSLIRNVAVGQEVVIMHGGSTSRTETTGISRTAGTSVSSSSGTNSGSTSSESTSMRSGAEESTSTESWGVSSGESFSETSGSSESETESTTTTVSEANSWTQSFKTLYEPAPHGIYSLEEQRYRKVAWLKRQPRQMALLVRPDFSLVPFRVAAVRPPLSSPTTQEDFILRRFRDTACVRERSAVREEIAARERQLLQAAGIDEAAPDAAVAGAGEFDPWA